LANALYKNILQRLPAGLILALSVFGILYLQNIYIIFALIIIAGFMLIKEWLSLSDSSVSLKQVIFVVTIIICSFFFEEVFIDLLLLAILIFWVIFSFCLIFNKKLSFISFDNNYLGAFLVFGFIFGLIHLIFFSEFTNLNKFFVLFIILFNVVIADIGAYLVGSSIGKTPLFPNISPNKTIEGLMGGAALVIIFITSLYFFDLISVGLLLASLISFPFAFVGDYFESQLKRSKSVKDSGSLIPGHGGIWDRLDSHIAVMPIFICLTHLML